MSLINDIKISSLSEAQDIIKSIGTEDIFEKAHKDGDLHPNGKWVWVSSAAGGKGDWRTLNGRTHKKHQANNASGGSAGGSTDGSSGSGGSGTGSTGSSAGSSAAVNKKFTIKDYEHWGHASMPGAKGYGLFNPDTNLASIVMKDKINNGFIVTIRKQNNKYASGSMVEAKLFSSRKQAMEYGIRKIQEKVDEGKKTATSTSSTTAKLTSQKLNDLADGSSIIIKNGQTGNSHIELTKENGQWYYKDTRRTKQKTTSDKVLQYYNDYIDKKMYRVKENFVKSSSKAEKTTKGDTSSKTKVKTSNLSDALIKECSKDIEQSRTEVINDGYSLFDREINFNGKKQTIYVKLYKKDNIGRKKSYEISVGTEFGNIKKISETTYIGSADIKAAIKSYFDDKSSVSATKKTPSDKKKSDLHVVDMQERVGDKNSLLKQLKSAKSNKVLIHSHSTFGFDINKIRPIAEKEGWKITDRQVDKNGNHTYDVNSYMMFEKQNGASKKKTTPTKIKSVPAGKKVNYDDDIVDVYDDKGKKVYSGMLDYCPFKNDDYVWNSKDKNYDLENGYKMVGK